MEPGITGSNEFCILQGNRNATVRAFNCLHFFNGFNNNVWLTEINTINYVWLIKIPFLNGKKYI